MDLLELRGQLDQIDEQIVRLYEERMDICSQVADYKIETGKKVLDKSREEEKLRKVRALAHNDFNAHGVQELFEQIMSMSRKLQYNSSLRRVPAVNCLLLPWTESIQRRQGSFFKGRKAPTHRWR